MVVAVLLRRSERLFPRQLRALFPLDAQLVQPCNAFRVQTARALARADLTLRLEPAAQRKPVLGDIAIGQTQIPFLGSGLFRRCIEGVPAGFQLLFEQTIQVVALTHRLFLPEARVLASGADHRGRALFLEDAAIAQAVEAGRQVKDGDGLTAARHQCPTEHLTEPAGFARLADQDRTGQPLDGLLDARCVDAEQDLGTGGRVGTERLPRRRIGQTAAVRLIEAHRRVHAAQEVLQLVPDGLQIIPRLEHGQIPALRVAEDPWHQRGRVLGLTHRPADLLILRTQRVGLGRKVQILDAGAKLRQLAFLRPEHGHIVGRDRQGPHGHGFAHRHPGDDGISKQLLGRLTVLFGAVGHGQAQQFCLRAETEQLLSRFCPACRCQLVVAVEDQIIGFLCRQRDPLFGGRFGQKAAIAELQIRRQGPVVVAGHICLAQGHAGRSRDQPEERPVRMALDQLPRDAAFSGPGRMGDRRLSASFQRRFDLFIGSCIDFVQDHSHSFSLRDAST